MSKAALICDTGALLDYLVATAPDHRAFREAIDRSRTRYVPGLALAEVDYFLREERQAMAALMRDICRGAFTYAAPTVPILDRAVDASVVALAEELGVYRLATRDVRHFSAVRLRGGKSFEFVVQPRMAEH
jgi:predicted nucleic acid-binding protein